MMTTFQRQQMKEFKANIKRLLKLSDEELVEKIYNDSDITITGYFEKVLNSDVAKLRLFLKNSHKLINIMPEEV